MLVAIDDAEAPVRPDGPLVPDAQEVQDLSVPIFIINLDRDTIRRTLMLDQLSRLRHFSAHFVCGSNGSSLPSSACEILVQDGRWSKHKGTIGCFLSHVQVWEEVAGLSAPYAVVVEDDVRLDQLAELPSIDLPEDAELVFLNDRMSPSNMAAGPPEVLPLWHALRKLDGLRSGGPGGDGYLLTPGAATKMLAACARDLFFGHVDGRLLRYAASEADLSMLAADSWIAAVIRLHHHPKLVPPLGVVRGFCLSRPLVSHKGMPSSREAVDSPSPPASSPVTGTASERSGVALEARPAEPSSMIAIRYWNRISNIGDLINPHVVEAISGRRPYFATDTSQDHVLGIGSIFFMANEHSHIWGSGMLDPRGDYSRVSHSNVRAVRGTFTRDVLRRSLGFTGDPALGDPGIFVDEIPEVAACLKKAQPRRRVALIPHYAMISDREILRLAAELDADILSPRTSSIDFLGDLAASEIIVSQSLHGLIFAETLGKPSVWITHDQGDLWTFKFHDWFSNTVEPPASPLPLSVSGAAALSHARLSGLSVDRARLRSSFPYLPAGGRMPGIPYGVSRARPPYELLIAPHSRRPSSNDYDATVPCEIGNEAALRTALNHFSRKFDDAVSCFLIFDVALYESMSVSDRRRLLEALTDRPDLHYVGMLPISSAQGDGQAVPAVPNAACNWKGAMLVRNLINFSFDAPGRIWFKY